MDGKDKKEVRVYLQRPIGFVGPPELLVSTGETLTHALLNAANVLLWCGATDVVLRVERKRGGENVE